MSERAPQTVAAVAAPAAARTATPSASSASSAPSAPNAPTAQAPTDMAALTPAQKKALAKAEKAARRGNVVANKVAPPPAAAPAAKGPKKTTTATGGPTPVPAPVQKLKGPEIPNAYSHLSIAKKLPLSKADKDVHPSILAIGQQMASSTLKDNAARLEAMLIAFLKVSHANRSLKRTLT